MNINIIVFRHGESLGNKCSRLLVQGKEEEIPPEYYGMRDRDFPLTLLGKEQARLLSSVISNLTQGIRVLPITSPFIRAQQTAQIVSKSSDWQLEERFIERDFGDILAFRKKFGHEAVEQEFHKSFRDPDYLPFLNGKSFRETVERVSQALSYWQNIAAECNANTILISAHGEVLRALRALAHRIELNQYHQRLGGMIYNCQIDHFSISCPENSDVRGMWYRTLPAPYIESSWQKIR